MAREKKYLIYFRVCLTLFLRPCSVAKPYKGYTTSTATTTTTTTTAAVFFGWSAGYPAATTGHPTT